MGDTCLEKKKFLKRYQKINKRIECLEEKLSRTDAQLTTVQISKYSGNPRSAMPMTMEDIVNCLRLKDISTPAMMTYNKILRAQLLAIDDIMLFPVKREEATAFFNLINTLHEKTSIIITTNKAPTEWVETLNDEILASALLDRLLYRCEVIKFTGSSYRLENRQTIFKTTTGTRNELMKP